MRELANLNLQLWVAKTEGFASAWRRWDRRMLNVLAPFSQWPEVWSTWILASFLDKISQSLGLIGARHYDHTILICPCCLVLCASCFGLKCSKLRTNSSGAPAKGVCVCPWQSVLQEPFPGTDVWYSWTRHLTPRNTWQYRFFNRMWGVIAPVRGACFLHWSLHGLHMV